MSIGASHNPQRLPTVGRILNGAVNGVLVAATPCWDITLPKIEDTEKRYLSPTEITLLADTIDPRYARPAHRRPSPRI